MSYYVPQGLDVFGLINSAVAAAMPKAAAAAQAAEAATAAKLNVTLSDDLAKKVAAANGISVQAAQDQFKAASAAQIAAQPKPLTADTIKSAADDIIAVASGQKPFFSPLSQAGTGSKFTPWLIMGGLGFGTYAVLRYKRIL